MALVGHSGSGKSTLLRLIAGLEPLDGGSVAIGGREVATPEGGVPPEKRGVGMMFQDYALFPHLTVIRNVMFGLRSHARDGSAGGGAQGAVARRPRRPRRRLSAHALRRRAAARGAGAGARAAAAHPAHGRAVLQPRPADPDRWCARTPSPCSARAGTTVILVTHDQDDAMRMADRILMMQGGRIVQGGTAEELCRRAGDARGGALLRRVERDPRHEPRRRGGDAGGGFPRARPCRGRGGDGLHPPGRDTRFRR